MFLLTLRRSGWPAHASFMDGLVADGFIVLGGAALPTSTA